MKKIIIIGILLVCFTDIINGIHLRQDSKDKSIISQSQKEYQKTKKSSEDKIKELKQIQDYQNFVMTLSQYLEEKDGGDFRHKLNEIIEKEGGLKLTLPNEYEKSKENFNPTLKGKSSQLHLIPIEVSKLRPTQNAIGLENSLKRIKSRNNTDDYFNLPVVLGFPIVTYNKAYVLDGHHRWSQLYMMNPKATMWAYNIEPINDEKPKSILRRMQVAIGAFFGLIPSSSASNSTNVYGPNFTKIDEYLQEITKGKDSVSLEFLLSMKEHLGWSSSKEEELRDELYKYLKKNIQTFRNTIRPISNAPGREFMPQTDGGDDKNKADIKDMSEVLKDKDGKIDSTILAVMSTLTKKSSKLNE